MTIVVLGGLNEDIVALVSDLPRRGETVTAIGIERIPGGKGLNQAVAASRQGGLVRMLGAVGDDPAGDSLRDLMTREDIDIGGLAVLAGRSTGQALIALAHSGDNTIVVNAAANAAYGAADVASADIDAKVFLTQFEARLDAIAALFTSVEGEKGIRILNAAPALQEGRHLLAHADIIVLNETELQVFANSPDVLEEKSEIAAAARSLMSRSDQHVVVTLGHLGCLHVHEGRADMIPGFRVETVDTIGAGDCFCGVLAAGLDTGAGIGEALRRANAAAAISVTRRGGAKSSPLRKEVDALMVVSQPG